MSPAIKTGPEGRGTPEAVTWNNVLPPLAPYVTPHRVVSDIFDSCAHVRRGWFRHMHVYAPRGFGKTRLLNEVAAELTQQGDALVVFAEASDQGATAGSVLEQIFVQVAAACRVLPPSDREAIQRSALGRAGALSGVIARATPTFAGWLGLDSSLRAPQIDVGESFSRQANVLANVLSVLGSEQYPLVIVVDSLDRVDVASRALLDALTQHRHQNTLLVTASRFEQSLQAKPDIEHNLEPLTRSGVVELVERSLPGPVGELPLVSEILHTETRGRPLDCWATLQEWVNRGDLSEVRGQWVLSQSSAVSLAPVETLCGRRLSRLSEDAHHLVLGLALSYSPLREADLGELLGWRAERVSSAVGEAVESAIIQSLEGRFDFNHGIVRERTIERASEQDICAHHRGLAEWLAKSRPIRPAALAFHREHSTPDGLDEELARLHLEAAQKCLDVFDVGRAKWFAQRGLQRTRKVADRAALTRALADAELLGGDQAAAARAYKQSIDLAPNTEMALRIASDCVYTIVCQSGERAARAVTMHALRRAGLFRGETTAHTFGALAGQTLRLLAGRPCEEPEAVRDAICALATRSLPAFVTEPFALLATSVYAIRAAKGLRTADAGTVLALEGILLGMLGMEKRSERVFRDALQIAEQQGSAWHNGLVLHQYAHSLLFPADRIDEGVEMMERAIAAFRESGDTSVALLSYMFLAFYTERTKTLEERIAVLDEGLQLSHLADGRLHLGVVPVRALRCLFEMRAGLRPRDDVDSLLEQLTDPRMQPIERVVSSCFIADSLCIQGQTRKALDLASSIAEGLHGPQIETACHVYLTVVRAASQCDLDAGDRRRVKRVERKAKQLGKRYRFFARALAETRESTGALR